MNRSKIIVAVAALVIMFGGAGMLLRLKASQRLGNPGLKHSPTAEGLRVNIELPEHVLDYVSTNLAPEKVEVDMLPKDTSFARRLYRAPDGFSITLAVVLMGTDRTSIHKPEYCLTSQGWQILGRETAALPMTTPHAYSLPVREFRTSRLVQLPGGGQERWSGLYFFWFVADEHLTASHWARVGLITRDLLQKGVLPRWAYVSAFVVCPPGLEAQAAARLRQFLTAAVPAFQTTAGPVETGAPAP
jgi:hypothetical protein